MEESEVSGAEVSLEDSGGNSAGDSGEEPAQDSSGLSKSERKRLKREASARRREEESRQMQTQTKKKKLQKWVFLLVILGVFLGGVVYAVGRQVVGPGKYDAFAQCLTEKGMVEYGAYWCPNCAEQKRMFGKSFQYLTYVECDARGKNGDPALCNAKGISGYPTWITAEGEELRGVQQFETLARISGCELPS